MRNIMRFSTGIFDRNDVELLVGDKIIYFNDEEWGEGFIKFDLIKLQIIIEWTNASDLKEVGRNEPLYYFGCREEIQIIGWRI